MITKIHLENFKCIKERQTIELKPITLLFGPNSAGKSTVIQALHYMREILVRQNFNADRTLYGGEVIDLGGFENLVYNHDLNLPIIMQFDLDLSKSDIPSYDPYSDVDFYFYDERVNEKGRHIIGHREEREIIDTIYLNSKSAYVKVKVEWKEEINGPLVTKYETGFNDKAIASIVLNRIMASKQGYYEIEFLNLLHPIFPKEPLWENEKIKVTKLFLWFIRWIGWDVDKINVNISFPLLNQKTAIPPWNKFINVDQSIIEKSEDVDYLEKNWFIPEFFTTILTGPGELLKNLLEKFRYIGPIRKIPNRYFVPTKTPNEARWADGLAAWDLLYKSEKKFLNEVNNYLFKREYLNTGYEIKFIDYKDILGIEENRTIENTLNRLREIRNYSGNALFLTLKKQWENMNLNFENFWKRNFEFKGILKIVDKNNNVELSLKDVGVGISQIIPVIVGAVSQEYSILAVEQPELHNHPKIQVSLADVFIEQINKKPDVIYLLETHSEHFMLRLLRRIEETTENEVPNKELKLRPDQISVNWFEPDENGTKIINLPVDETGEFTKPWPQGFFEERAKELFR